MNTRHFVVPVLISLSILCVFISNTIEQEISGKVRDDKGFPIKDARITLFSSDTALFFETRSDSLGNFNYAKIPIAYYRIGATSIGRQYTTNVIFIHSGKTFDTINFTLATDTNKGSWEVLNKAGEKLGGTNSATLLPDGRIMYCHDTQDPILFDPVAKTYTKAAKSQKIQGCAAVGLTLDGKVIFVGGAETETYGAGTKQVKTYDPATDTWKVENSINDYRWYPSMVRFPDGELLIIGGGGIDNPKRVKTCEILDPQSMTWKFTDTVAIGNEVSPIVLLKTGEVLMTHRPPQIFNTQTKKWRLAADFVQSPRNPDGNHPDHEITLLPEGKVVAIGYNPVYFPSKPANNIEIYDPILNNWKLGSNILPIRYQSKSTLLPDKKILVTGGFKATSSDTSYINEWGAMRITDMYDPYNDSWQRMSGMNYAREYHSTPLLIPDGRVVVTGGEGKPGEEPKDTSVVEAFSPPYLFKGIRPEIKDLTKAIFPRGSEIAFRIAKTSAPTTIILMGVEAVTHFMNTGNARYINLSFTQNGDTIHAMLPSDDVEIPVGFYTLFAMTDDIPSVGKIVNIIPSVNKSVTDVHNLPENQAFAYPNPFHNKTSVLYFLKDQSNIEINLYDILGKKVKQFDVGSASAGWNSFSLNEPMLVPGVYTLRFKTENSAFTVKLSVYH